METVTKLQSNNKMQCKIHVYPHIETNESTYEFYLSTIRTQN